MAQLSSSLSPIDDVSLCGGTPSNNVQKSTCVVEGEASVSWITQTQNMRHEIVLPSGERTDFVQEQGVIIALVVTVSNSDPFISEIQYYPYNFSLPTTLSCKPASSPTTNFSRTVANEGILN